MTGRPMTMGEIVEDEGGPVYSLEIAPESSGIVPRINSEWTAHLLGSQILVNPEKGKHPNMFHRFMQRLFFGVIWVKKED